VPHSAHPSLGREAVECARHIAERTVDAAAETIRHAINDAVRVQRRKWNLLRSEAVVVIAAVRFAWNIFIPLVLAILLSRIPFPSHREI
jgi:hypothetical protein